MKLDNRGYKGKKVFVGIDVHKKTYAVAAISEGVVVKSWSMRANKAVLLTQLRSFFEGAEIFTAYEAGFSGFALHRFLEEHGIISIVVNAGSIAVESNNRVKTDKKDAKKISRQLSLGLLRGIYIPTEEQEDRRSLSRGRQDVVERRQATGNQIKMKLHYLGIEVSDVRVSERFMKEVEALEVSPGHKEYLREQIASWREDTKRILRFNKLLKEQAEKDKLEKIYRSAPGIGAISARVLSNELGDMGRFSNGRELSSNIGLTPSEYSSGEYVRKGHITRQGNPRVRAILVEVAWRAIREDQGLREIYENIKSRKEGKKAIVAVARRMLLRLRKCLIDDKPWEDLGATTA